MPTIRASFTSLVAGLHACSRVLDGSQSRRKISLLKQAAAAVQRIGEARHLRSLHESLLFIAAFPDNSRIHRLAESALARLGRRLMANDTPAERRLRAALANSGIAGTVIRYEFSLDALRWLAQRFGRDVAFTWRNDALSDEFEDALAVLAFPVEYDGLLDPRLSVGEWSRLSAAKRHEVAWVVSLFDRLRETSRCADPHLLDHYFDSLGLTVRWRLRDRLASRTACRFPARPMFFQAGAAAAPAAAPALDRIITAPLPRGGRPRLRAAQQEHLVDIARATLAARCRETDPVTHANARDVVLLRLERGIDVLMLGLQPSRRLPIEAYVGYVAARNRIPIAYGGAWIAFDACTIGINLFETFRGGESAVMFAHILRAYRALFDLRRFRVDPYQFGEDNEEAIRSGAFWFYWRMGFRPVQRDLRDLAEREAARIRAQRGYRTGAATLRRLATGQLEMDLSGHRPASRTSATQPAVNLGGASLAVTRWIARGFQGDRGMAAAEAVRRVARALGRSADDAHRARWPRTQQHSFESLAMLFGLIDDLPRWPAGARAALLKIMRLKGGPSEMAYARALRRHQRLQTALARIASQSS
jgi:hypothetical protein